MGKLVRRVNDEWFKEKHRMYKMADIILFGIITYSFLIGLFIGVFSQNYQICGNWTGCNNKPIIIHDNSTQFNIPTQEQITKICQEHGYVNGWSNSLLCDGNYIQCHLKTWNGFDKYDCIEVK